MKFTMDSKSDKLFSKLFFILYLLGIGDFWEKRQKWPLTYIIIHYVVITISRIMILLMIMLEYSGFFAKSPTVSDKLDTKIYTIAHTVFYSYLIIAWVKRDGIKNIVTKLCIDLPSLYNNDLVRIEMEKEIKKHTVTYLLAVYCAIVMYGIVACLRVVKYGETFSIVITGWPDKSDTRTLALLIKICIYTLWYVLMLKIIGVFVLVMSQTVCLRRRFKHLQCYFLELNEIFHEDLSQEEKDLKYELKFMFGMKMHSETLWCVRNIQKYLSFVYSGQTFMNVSMLVLLTAQTLSSERSIPSLLSFTLTIACVLLTTGAFMWYAGDVTVEASNLPNAIFHSGWHNCGPNTGRKLRSLIVVSIGQAQVPVVLKAFGLLPMSYSTNVSIMKSTYSVFTVFY